MNIPVEHPENPDEPADLAEPPTSGQAELTSSPESLSSLLLQMQPVPLRRQAKAKHKAQPDDKSEATDFRSNDLTDPLTRGKPSEKKPRLLTDAELKWFDVRRYDKESLLSLSLSDWRALIADRFTVFNCFKYDYRPPGETQIIFEIFFETLKRNPLEITNRTSWQRRHSTDMPSINLMTHEEAISLGRETEMAVKANFASSYVLSGAKFDEMFIYNQVPALINFNVTKSQLIADFEVWVDNIQAMNKKLDSDNKLFPSLMKNWANSQCLPYFDLKLFALSRRSQITQRQYVSLLGLDPDKELKNELEKPRDWSRKVFSSTNLNAIRARLARNEILGIGEMYTTTVAK